MRERDHLGLRQPTAIKVMGETLMATLGITITAREIIGTQMADAATARVNLDSATKSSPIRPSAAQT